MTVKRKFDNETKTCTRTLELSSLPSRSDITGPHHYYATMLWRKSKLNASFESVSSYVAASAFNTGFDSINLQHPTVNSVS